MAPLWRRAGAVLGVAGGVLVLGGLVAWLAVRVFGVAWILSWLAMMLIFLLRGSDEAKPKPDQQRRGRTPDPTIPAGATSKSPCGLASRVAARAAQRRSAKLTLPAYWNCAAALSQDRGGDVVELTKLVPWRQRFKRLFRPSEIDGSVSFEIENVWRFEQPRLYGLYAAHRDTQLRSRPPVLAAPLTSVAIAPEWLVELGLRSTQANEVMLWHGTKLEHIHSIMQEGFDERVGRLSGLFGAGVYFAEDPAKADQYTGPGDSDGGEPVHRLMFLSRVSLGAFAEVQDVTLDARRPPDGFDSVVGCADGAFREFVTYDGWLAYPEFLVQYVRITK